ncbi:hypothetical protein [Bacteroides sp. UBA939]|uniref:hypothetical protein n=1 Tax=Bacteroides sp. UBA939 TaxID=1946092 RepID=UPI0025C289E7|nr:hypothetical protein [Bacteroides sp. UBA939]
MDFTFLLPLIISVVVTSGFVGFQLHFFKKTRRYQNLFNSFFKKKEAYSKYMTTIGDELYLQLLEVGESNSDLNSLIQEINRYVVKTKGTTDFTVIQNKVERKLNMRYDQSTTHLAFPTYLGLMGTFVGVFMGILMFLLGFDNAGNISDDSIKNLLIGTLVSMFTSLCGLLLTTINNALAGNSRKQIEEDKNDFYDFVQTELMPSINVSLVSAIGKLHETVDRFEPAFDGVINRFQTTFDKCTLAFGKNFEKNVVAVAGAVEAMGKNMDKINENIQYQKELIQTMKSDQLATGMDKYIEAAHQFISITQSLNKFEEARRMMLAAAQESINLQNAYADSLKIPHELAVRINQILDRVKEFETSINLLGGQLSKREILGNDVVNKLQEQISAIGKKQKIADNYLEEADDKLEHLFKVQTKTIMELNERYKRAIEGHIEGFEEMIKLQTTELEIRHAAFMRVIEERLSIEDVRSEFVNLSKLEDINNKLVDLKNIDQKITELSDAIMTTDKIKTSVVDPIKLELSEIKTGLKQKDDEKPTGVLGGLFRK